MGIGLDRLEKKKFVLICVKKTLDKSYLGKEGLTFGLQLEGTVQHARKGAAAGTGDRWSLGVHRQGAEKNECRDAVSFLLSIHAKGVVLRLPDAVVL